MPPMDPRLVGQRQMPSMSKPTLHDQLDMHIKRGELAKQLKEMLDSNPSIQEFVAKANEL